MNDKVYWFRGWKLRRIEGEIKGYVANLFGEARAVILITKSESKAYNEQPGRYMSMPIDQIREIP